MVKHKEKIVSTVDLDFAGPSTFQGNAVVEEKGDYELIVYAYDAQTGNTGVDKVKVQVQ